MIISIHQPEHLPYYGFFNKMRASDAFVVLDDVQYSKNSFQNRNRIRSKNGFIWLTVPVLTKGKNKQAISEVIIDNRSNWKNKVLKSIHQNYNKAKYFDGVYPILETVYNVKYEKLYDLNIGLLHALARYMKITIPIIMSSYFDVPGSSTEKLVNICKAVSAKTYLSGPGGRDYLDIVKFGDIDVRYADFIHPAYLQQHSPFIENMSIVDMLMNKGELL